MPAAGGSLGGASSGAVRAGKAYVELYADDSRLQRALKSARDSLAKFGSSVAGLGLKGLLGGAAGLAPLGGIFGSITETGKLADTAKAFGLSGEAASRLFGILKAGGSDLRDATEAVATFNQRIEDAIKGTGEEAAEVFRDLGKLPQQFQNLNSAERIYALLDALKQVPDPAKRVQIAMKAVGEDSGKNLIRTLARTPEELQRLGDALQMTQADLDAASSASLSLTTAGAYLSKVWNQVVTAVAPVMEQLAKAILPYAQLAALIVRNNPQVVTGFFAVAAGVAAAGAAGLGLSAVFTGLSALFAGLVVAVKLLAAVFGFLLSPVGLAAAAVAGVLYLLATKTESGRSATEDLKTAFVEMGAAFSETWRGVVDAVTGGELKLAFEILGAGIVVAWEAMLYRMRKALEDFRKSVIGESRAALLAVSAIVPPLGLLLRANAAIGGGPNTARLDAARAALAALTGRAATAAERARQPNPGEVSNSLQAAQIGVAQAVRGTFQTGGIAGQIFGGQSGIGKIIEQANKANKKLDEIKAAIVGLNLVPRFR